MAEVRFEHVSKVYQRGTAAAVEDFSLTVKDGEFLVLVGPSGCGKSTSLRMVAGLETPTSGSIYIGGREVTRMPPKDRDIAMVFQNYALYPHMTVAENLSFALRLRHMSKAEIARRVSAAAETLGLTPYLRRLPKALSGGQRQRVALGRAIVREPAVFLFDEPLSNLDAKKRVEMRAEIIRLHHELKSTMIYVTHDQTEAMTMGGRIVVMNLGRIQQVAPPLEVYRRPANPFVASFIGTPPMNLVAGGLIGKAADVLIGIHPEDIALVAEGEAGAFAARVDFTEPLGPETLVHVKLEDAPIVVRAPGFVTLPIGATVGLKFDFERAVEFNGGGDLI